MDTKIHLFLALTTAFFGVITVAAEQEIITYNSPQVDCSWLDIEYDVIKSHASNPTPPQITHEGIGRGALMTFGMLLTMPAEIIRAIFGDKQPRYEFSRNVEDIFVVAKTKKCSALLQLMEEDKRDGLYPPPPIVNE